MPIPFPTPSLPAACCASALLVLLAACGPRASEQPDAPPFQAGDRIVFFGDSITELGVEPGGYVTLIDDSLQHAYPNLDVDVVGAGVSGNRVPDLLARVDRDVLARDPDVVVVYIGINDVWHWALNDNGTPRDAYETGLRQLVDTLQQADAEVVLCTPSVIGERPGGVNEQDAMLDEYAGISRRVAADYGLRVCDLRAAFTSYLEQHNPDSLAQGILTNDGVHLNDAGNRLVADTIIETLTP